jgi:hypothetical protein
VLVAAFFLIGALMLGLTTYTLPNHGTPSYATLRSLITSSLGDPPPALPSAEQNLEIQATTPSRPHPEDHAAPEAPASTVPAAQAVEWVRAAAARDSTALRNWLDPLVLVTAVTEGDTVRTVLRRLSIHGRCPVLSTLRLTSVGRAPGHLRLIRISGSCPPGLSDAHARAHPATDGASAM